MPTENISMRFPMMDIHITTKGQDFNLKLNFFYKTDYDNYDVRNPLLSKFKGCSDRNPNIKKKYNYKGKKNDEQPVNGVKAFVYTGLENNNVENKSSYLKKGTLIKMKYKGQDIHGKIINTTRKEDRSTKKEYYTYTVILDTPIKYKKKGIVVDERLIKPTCEVRNITRDRLSIVSEPYTTTYKLDKRIYKGDVMSELKRTLNAKRKYWDGNLKNLIPLYDNNLVVTENDYEDNDEYEEKLVDSGDVSKSLINFKSDITKIINETFELNTLFTPEQIEIKKLPPIKKYLKDPFYKKQKFIKRYNLPKGNKFILTKIKNVYMLNMFEQKQKKTTNIDGGKMYDIVVDLLVDLDLTFKKALTKGERENEKRMEKRLRILEDRIINNRLLKNCDNKKLKLNKLWNDVIKEFTGNADV